MFGALIEQHRQRRAQRRAQRAQRERETLEQLGISPDLEQLGSDEQGPASRVF